MSRFPPSPGDQLAALATKLAHLLRLSRYPRPYPRFKKNRKRSTCGFVFAPCGMVGDRRTNVVNGPISWRASHAAARRALCRSVFYWVGILPSAIHAGMRRYPNAGQRIDSKEGPARDGSRAPRPNNRAYDGGGAATQPVRCRVCKQKVADRVHRCARGTGASVGFCCAPAFCRHQDLGLNYRGHRPKEG